MDFLAVLNEIDNFIWGPPLLVLLVGTGILLTIRLHLLQIFKLPKALSLISERKMRAAEISTVLRLFVRHSPRRSVREIL